MSAVASGEKPFASQRTRAEPRCCTSANRAHLCGTATLNGSAPDSMLYRMMPSDHTSAFAASYPDSFVDASTSGAAYMSEPHLVCWRKEASSWTVAPIGALRP